MRKLHVESLKTIIRDYGALGSVSGLVIALREIADDYSDMGIKERAAEADQLSNALEEIVGTGLELSDDLVLDEE